MSVVVENPDGPLLLGVSKDNPYKEVPQVPDSGHPVYFGETVIFLSNEDVQNALELERRSGVVRILCGIDLFTNMFSFMMTGMLLSMLLSFLSLSGYYGALYYNRRMLIGYMTYQVLLTVAKVAVFIYLLTQGTFVVYLPILIFIQVYVATYVINFYRILPKTCPEWSQV